jgi:choline dehydrogenase
MRIQKIRTIARTIIRQVETAILMSAIKNSVFDYIIVGAGSAGCVLANRLSEDPHTTVLLLEAGSPDRKQEFHIPAAAPKLFKTPHDWAYQTEEQTGLNNRHLYWPRGKVLGGSSSINVMIYSRANRCDHDQWRDLGNQGWGYDEALTYYKKAQNQERGASQYHAEGGPLNVADLRYINPLSRVFVEAGAEIGLSHNNDFNGAEQEGIGFFQVTQKNGKRHSAAAAYLKPILRRPNLTIRTEAQVTQVLFEKQRATGIEYIQAGIKLHQVRANREIILSGGAINSPQLLMLSGIGPAGHLKSSGIPVRFDLPGVGQNLQDHLLAVTAYQCVKPITLAGAETLKHIANYLFFKKGPLTSNIAEAGGFIKTQSTLPAPDIELLFAPAYFLNHGFSNPEGHGFSVGAVLQRPESRGFLRLRSNKPTDSPIIQPNYLDSENDLKVLIDALILARAIAQAKVFDTFRGAEVAPAEALSGNKSIADFIRANAESCYHPVGTCKMGSDEMAVTDARLRVHGVEGLRVVDASIFPSQITGHTNAPTIMIAEKAADIIQAEK